MADNEDVLDKLAEEQQRVNKAINTVREVAKNGSKYKADQLAALLTEVKAAFPADAVVSQWDGTAKGE